MIMKKRRLADAAMLMLIPISIVGFSLSTTHDSISKPTTETARVNNIAETTDTEYQLKGTNAEIQPLDFRPSRVYRVRYAKTNFKATLDEDYREEKLYRYVPGAKKNNRAYSWSRIKARTGKRVFVDMKAKAYYRDDDGERESEDFYRIRVSNSSKAQKYWVNEDAIED